MLQFGDKTKVFGIALNILLIGLILGWLIAFAVQTNGIRIDRLKKGVTQNNQFAVFSGIPNPDFEEGLDPWLTTKKPIPEKILQKLK